MPTPTNSPSSQDPNTTPSSSPTSKLPSVPLNQIADPRRLLWLGGLATMGVVGILEWPVVAAVGVGSFVAEQLAKSDVRQSTR